MRREKWRRKRKRRTRRRKTEGGKLREAPTTLPCALAKRTVSGTVWRLRCIDACVGRAWRGAGVKVGALAVPVSATAPPTRARGRRPGGRTLAPRECKRECQCARACVCAHGRSRRCKCGRGSLCPRFRRKCATYTISGSISPCSTMNMPSRTRSACIHAPHGRAKPTTHTFDGSVQGRPAHGKKDKKKKSSRGSARAAPERNRGVHHAQRVSGGGGVCTSARAVLQWAQAKEACAPARRAGVGGGGVGAPR